MVVFCALLYYKKLLNKQDVQNTNDIAQLIRNKKNKRKIQNKDDSNSNNNNNNNNINIELKITASSCNRVGTEKNYNQRIVNKWHVLVKLLFNKTLISFRKSSSSHRQLIT
jgi:hypothetical protein